MYFRKEVVKHIALKNLDTIAVDPQRTGNHGVAGADLRPLQFGNLKKYIFF